MRADSTPSGDEDMKGYRIGICFSGASGGRLAPMKGIFSLFDYCAVHSFC